MAGVSMLMLHDARGGFRGRREPADGWWARKSPGNDRASLTHGVGDFLLCPANMGLMFLDTLANIRRRLHKILYF